MKTIKYILTLLIFHVVTTGVSQTITKSSIDNGGAAVINGNIQLLYTIGEVNIREMTSGAISISEGFINGFALNTDDDNDGIENDVDLCPNTPTGETVDTNGCSDSQLDDDDDGVMNNIDTCPNTPTGETVDANGCSDSQLDDDNDGVMNDVDTCPNTPTGEPVDANGCSDSQTDTDGDGVLDNADNCPDTSTGETVDANGCSDSQTDTDGDGVMDNTDTCPDTPTGETVDENGCSDSQLDDDNDGVMNDVDTCPNTPTGETVDATGCSESQDDDDNDGIPNDLDQCSGTPTGEAVDANGCMLLASNNFNIETISETCPNKNNGQIIITAQASYSYIATINGTDYNFTTDLTIDNLSPGNYEICIVVTGQTSPYCFNLEIKVGTTVSGKSSSTKNKTTVEIIEGTAPYDVLVNGNMVLRTLSSTFDIDTKHGDLIEVKTDISCEGVFSKTIQLFDVITLYPNPTDGLFEIGIPLNLEEVGIELYNYNSQLISKRTYPVNYGKVQLDLTHKSTGVYLVRVLVDNPVTLKIIKK